MNRFALRAMLVAAAAVAAAPQARAQTLAITPEMARATFDTAWARIDRTYYDTAFLNTRWKVLRDSLRPIALGAKTNAELRTVLQKLIAGVGVSHFGLIPQEISPALTDRTKAPPAGDASGAGTTGGAAGGAPATGLTRSGDIGASLRLVGDQLIVARVDSGGAAWKQGVRPGDEVRRLDDLDATEAIAQLKQIGDPHVARQARLTAVTHANTQLFGRVGDTVTLGFASGPKVQSVPIAREPVRGQMSRVGNLPPLNAVLDASERTTTGPNGARRIGVIRFSVWLPILSSALDEALNRFRDADAIIIDLRGNPGGFAGMVSLVAGHLLDSAYALGSLRQRTVTLHLNANPQVRPFKGPVAILVDPLSGSTSEFFAGGLQALGRAHIVGDTSAGAALPAILDRLPNGDVMMHALADLTDAKGRRIEGVGVIPDEVVPLTIAGLSAGRDDQLAAALQWAARQPKSHKD